MSSYVSLNKPWKKGKEKTQLASHDHFTYYISPNGQLARNNFQDPVYCVDWLSPVSGHQNGQSYNGAVKSPQVC